MKIFVCLKQVPDTETKIKLAGDQIDLSGVKWVMNPYDEYAVEEALKIREKTPGATVQVITLGPKSRAAEVLRTGLAMGADEGILIDAPNPTEPLVTASALAQVIAQEGGAQLILTGRLAIDDNAASVGPMLAEKLKIPHVSVVARLSVEAEQLVAEREIEGGAKEIVQLRLPALVSANKGLNMPRYASLPGIMKAKKKVLKEIALDSLTGLPSSRTQIIKMELPPEKPAVQMLTGDAQNQAQMLTKLLRDEAKVL